MEINNIRVPELPFQFAVLAMLFDGLEITFDWLELMLAEPIILVIVIVDASAISQLDCKKKVILFDARANGLLCTADLTVNAGAMRNIGHEPFGIDKRGSNEGAIALALTTASYCPDSTTAKMYTVAADCVEGPF